MSAPRDYTLECLEAIEERLESIHDVLLAVKHILIDRLPEPVRAEKAQKEPF